MDKLDENLDNTFFGSIRKKVSTMFGNCDKDKRTPMEECQKMLNLLRQGKIRGWDFISKVQEVIDQAEPKVAEKLINFLDGKKIRVNYRVCYDVRIEGDGKTVKLYKHY